MKYQKVISNAQFAVVQGAGVVLLAAVSSVLFLFPHHNIDIDPPLSKT